LNRIASKGDHETIEKIGNHLSESLKKELSFDNRFCHSFVSQGKIDEYLNRLEKEIDDVKTAEDIKQAEFKFPRGGAIGLLEASPNSIDRFEVLARKYAAHNILGPINVFWMYHFIHGNAQKAEQVYKEFLSSAPRLMFHRIVQYARDKNDAATVEKLISILKNSSHISEGAIGNAYSALIDIYSTKGDAAQLSDVVKQAVDSVCLENINVTALTRAKQCVEGAGKNFPYKIPEKKASKDSSSSSSSSSSDDEVTRKEKSSI
jgi:leucine-rich PPR motif-containing protein